MKTCLKCQKQFKTLVKINGKNYVLGNRKFCLDCSPHGKHNTKNIISTPKLKQNEKQCPKCKDILPNTSQYFYNRTKRGDLSCYCKKCNTKVKVEQLRKVKTLSVEYLGGKCILCNYSKHPSALEFHHINPSLKDFEIGNSKVSSFEKIKPELNKCILICANCHRELHSGLHPQYLVVKEQL